MTIAIAVVRSASNHPAACCGDTYSLSAISEVTAVSHSAAPARRMRYCWRMDLRARSASSGSCADSSAEYRRIKIVHAPAVAHVLLDKVTADQRHELRPYRSVGESHQPTGCLKTYVAAGDDGHEPEQAVQVVR